MLDVKLSHKIALGVYLGIAFLYEISHVRIGVRIGIEIDKSYIHLI